MTEDRKYPPSARSAFAPQWHPGTERAPWWIRKQAFPPAGNCEQPPGVIRRIPPQQRTRSSHNRDVPLWLTGGE